MSTAMDILAIIGSPIGLVLVGYAALVGVLAVILQPVRLQMVALAEGLLEDRHFSREERKHINMMLDTMMSFRTGVLLLLAVISAILAEILRVSPFADDHSRLDKDPRFHHIVLLYLLSVLAANPLFAVLTLPLMVLHVVIGLMFGRTEFQEAIEEPAITASVASAIRGMAHASAR